MEKALQINKHGFLYHNSVKVKLMSIKMWTGVIKMFLEIASNQTLKVILHNISGLFFIILKLIYNLAWQ